MKRIIVASKNPIKTEAVRIGFTKMFPSGEFEYKGRSVPSGVADQPISNDETLTGAHNRCDAAFAEFPEAEYWVGVEGGIETDGGEMRAFAWVVVRSNDLTGRARTASFALPPEVVRLINEGVELGEADDIVFGKSNSKQKGGAVGLLTGNVIDRAKLYSEAVALALIPFRNPELYSTENKEAAAHR